MRKRNQAAGWPRRVTPACTATPRMHRAWFEDVELPTHSGLGSELVTLNSRSRETLSFLDVEASMYRMGIGKRPCFKIAVWVVVGTVVCIWGGIRLS